MKRREFIKACGLSVVSAGSLSLLNACNQQSVRTMPSNKHLSEIEIDKAVFFEQDYVFFEHPSLTHPVCVFKTKDDSFTASLMRCTHQKCTVAVKDDYYVCPCHGARFSTSGKVTRGPAETDLTTFPVRITQNAVFITL